MSTQGRSPPNVEIEIKRLIKGRVLHLFSGSSKIGNERIDIEHPNATRNTNVGDFIGGD